jgi:hypothetical protein
LKRVKENNSTVDVIIIRDLVMRNFLSNWESATEKAHYQESEVTNRCKKMQAAGCIHYSGGAMKAKSSKPA